MNNLVRFQITDYISEEIQETTNTARQLWPGMPEAKPFPFHVLPLKMQEYICHLREGRGAPKEFTAASMLWAAATATGLTYCILVNGEPRWAVIYLGLIGASNANKGGAIKNAFKPIKLRDDGRYKEYLAEKEVYDRLASMTKGELKKQGKTLPPEPVQSQTIIIDATPEATYQVHKNNPRGIGVHRDELMGFFNDFGRYNKSGEQQMWLSNWAFEPIQVNRASKGSTPIRIANPFICIAGGTQPGIIKQIAKGRVEDGFMARFIWVFRDDLKKPDWKKYEIPDDVITDYHRAINKLLDLKPGPEGEPNKITISPEAWEIIEDYFNNTNNPRANEATEDGKKAMLGKFDEQYFRLALALLFVRWAYSNEPEPPRVLDEATAQMAIEVNEYFVRQSERVYYHLTASPAESLKGEKRELYDALPAEFTLNEARKIRENLDVLSDATMRIMLRDAKFFTKQSHGKYIKL